MWWYDCAYVRQLHASGVEEVVLLLLVFCWRRLGLLNGMFGGGWLCGVGWLFGRGATALLVGRTLVVMA